MGQGMGGVFENLGTTWNISETPRVPLAPLRVPLGLCHVFSNYYGSWLSKGLSKNIKCDLSGG